MVQGQGGGGSSFVMALLIFKHLCSSAGISAGTGEDV